jgi:molybdenum ABC transporter molybdate-binding protein
MPKDELISTDKWALSLRVFVERGGKSVLGPGRLELLEHIDRLQSISAAARQMGMSYRRAWELVQAMNSAAGQPLVMAQTGGRRGGGTTLTPFGRQVASHFSNVAERLNRTAAEIVSRESSHTVHLFAAVSLDEVVGRVLTDFAPRRPELKVRTLFAASDELASLIRIGAPADLFLTAEPQLIDTLPQKPLRRLAIARNSLAIIAHTASKLPAGGPSRLLQRRRRRIALAAKGCPLGDYTAQFLAAAKITIAGSKQVIRVDNAHGVIAAVRSAQADIGIAYASDAVRAEECRILCRIDQLPTPIQYEGAAFGSNSGPSAAVQFLDFLSSRSAAARFHECGFQPATT